MQYRPILFSILIASLPLLAAQSHAAEWKECERAKLRQLKLEKRTSDSGKARKSRSGNSANSHRSAAELDEWLWKNCRSYAAELRRLEQSRM